MSEQLNNDDAMGAVGVNGDQLNEESMEGDESFDDDEGDLIEVIDADETDLGDLADDEDDEDLEEDEASAFTGKEPDFICTAHGESAVFCCAFDESGNRLITGGEDNAAYVWDSTSITNKSPFISKCGGHEDSVVSASFSSDSVYFSTCDMLGHIKIWKMGNLECVASFDVGELNWSFWHFGSHVIFAGCEDGTITMLKIPSGERKIYSGSSTTCECAALLWDGFRIVAGYRDGTVKIFELKSGNVVNLTAHSKYRDPILSICAHKTNDTIATGTSEGIVEIFNGKSGKLLGTFQCHPDTNTSESTEETSLSVESVAFYSDSNSEYLAAGTVQGYIVVFDMKHMVERCRLSQEIGLTRLLWHTASPVVFSAGLDGIVRGVDARVGLVTSQYGHHKSAILDIAITKDGRMLASSAEDGKVFLYCLVSPTSKAT